MNKNKKVMSLHNKLYCALFIFTLSVILTKLNLFYTQEVWIFSFINNNPPALKTVFIFISFFGSIFAFIATLFISLFIKRNLSIFLFVAGTLAYTLTGIAKTYLGRARPEELLSGVQSLEIIHGAGFPSGHTALATALALTINSYILKKYRFIPFMMLVLVGYSRIYLGVHFPLDIVGGLALGSAIFFATKLVFAKYKIKTQ